MPKRIQLPDGSIGEFPDDMPDEQIEGVLQKQFPAQPSAPAGPASPEDVERYTAEHGPAYRAAAGVARTLIPSWETVKMVGKAAVNPLGGLISRDADGKMHVGMPNVAQLWKDLAGGAVAGAKEQFEKARAAAPDMTPEEMQRLLTGTAELTPEQRAALIESGGYAAAGLIPFVGPAAAEAGERMTRGDVAGGLGEATGMLLPVARPVKRLGLGRRSVGALDRSAALGTLRAAKVEPAVGEQLLRTTTPIHALTPEAKTLLRQLQENPKALEAFRAAGGKLSDLIGPELQAPPEITLRVIQKRLGLGTRSTLAGRATAEMEHWQRQLRGLKEGPLSTEPIDVTPAAAELRGKVPEVELPAGKPTTLPPNWNEMGSAERQAFVDDMLKNAAEPTGPTAVSMDPALASGLKAQVATIEELAKAFPEGTPARDVFALRSQAGKAAARGGAYKKLPGQETSAAAEASKDAQAALSKTLHDSLPGLDAVDLKHSTWRKVSEALRKAVAEERLGHASAFRVMAARQAAAIAGGAGLGALVGGPAGAGIGAGLALGYGGWQTTSYILNSALWNSLSASGKLLLADAIESGVFGQASRASAAGAVAGRQGLGRPSQDVYDVLWDRLPAREKQEIEDKVAGRPSLGRWHQLDETGTRDDEGADLSDVEQGSGRR